MRELHLLHSMLCLEPCKSPVPPN
uniref:Uncharacterized protein n=1 Tax=Arundo donax TaxID=35708 RepID=A0A0A9HPW7_ARUDO